MSTTLTMRQLLEAGVHFGHNKRYWNPAMKPYIFGERQKIHIINLEKTLPMLRQALDFIAKTAANRGRVLFVGTKFPAREVLREAAKKCDMPYVDYRWLGGMLTNYKTIRQSIRRLKDIEAMKETKPYAALTKKERLSIQREHDKLEGTLSGIKAMGGLPDALFVIDAKEEAIAIQEANKLGIPVVAVVDTNTNPAGVDYVIPGNDDAIRAIAYYCNLVADVIVAERASLKPTEQERITKRTATATKRVVKKAPAPAADAEKSPATDAEPKAAVKKVVAKKTVAKKTVAKKSTAEKPAPDASADKNLGDKE